MGLKNMSCMAGRQLIMGIGLMLMAGLWLSPCYGDEITFKDENNAKIGTVIEMDEETVTIRFSRESGQNHQASGDQSP